MRRDEKDFLARKDLKYFDHFNQKMANLLKRDLGSLANAFDDLNIQQQETNTLKNVLREYAQHFTAFAELQKRIGLTPKMVYMVIYVLKFIMLKKKLVHKIISY